MGISATEDQIFSSAYATAAYLKMSNFKDRPKNKIYVIGHIGLVEELKLAGFETVWANDVIGLDHIALDKLSAIDIDPKVGAVLVGFDSTFTYSKNAYACRCIHSDPNVLLVATNRDKTFPSEGKILPGGGSVVASVETAALRQANATCGKPEPLLLELICKVHSLDAEKTLMVGDRLDTDILFGQSNGMDTALVMTGVTDEQTLTKSEIKPSYVLPSIAALLKE